MIDSRYRTGALDLLAAAGGAAVIGAILGMPEGPSIMLARAVSTPVILVGLVLLMIPPLYIATAMLGVAAPARTFVFSSLEALRNTGLVLLGFAPPLVFLIATSSSLTTIWMLGTFVVGLASLIGIRTLYTGLDKMPFPLFLIWLAIGLSIATQLFLSTLV